MTTIKKEIEYIKKFKCPHCRKKLFGKFLSNLEGNEVNCLICGETFRKKGLVATITREESKYLDISTGVFGYWIYVVLISGITIVSFLLFALAPELLPGPVDMFVILGHVVIGINLVFLPFIFLKRARKLLRNACIAQLLINAPYWLIYFLVAIQ